MGFRRTLPLYLGFAATGVGVALPGALLPALMLRWHMSDEQGGRLFLMAWIGSSLGSLLVRGALRTTLALGSFSIALAAAALGLCGVYAADLSMLVYGAGLGLAMTSISLIRQQQAARVGQEMVRLNLLWAVGAFLCPSLTVRALTTGSIRPLLFSVAASFTLLAAYSLTLPALRLRHLAEGGYQPWKVFARVPAAIILLTMLITGVEAAAGGWLATYANRDAHSVAATIAAPTCFWAGLLVSRLFWSFGERWFSPQTIVRGSLALMALASILLVATPAGGLILSAAFGLGFGIGPTYPLLLAWALDFDRGGAIFFLAGVGSSCLPWLTGLVSMQQGSLRLGLSVPLAGTLLMLVVALSSALGRPGQSAVSSPSPPRPA